MIFKVHKDLGVTMARRRKVRDERDARTLLEEADRSGLSLSEFCAQAGVDGRSLNCWRVNLHRSGAANRLASAPEPLRFLEVVSRQISAARATYRVSIAKLVIEVGDDFQEDTLGRLLSVAASW